MLLGLVEMLFGLVNVSSSLPEWQAVKMTFLHPVDELRVSSTSLRNMNKPQTVQHH